MNIGIAMTDPGDWTTRALIKSTLTHDAIPVPFRLDEIDSHDFKLSGVGGMDEMNEMNEIGGGDGVDGLDEMSGIIVRDVGAGAFEEVSFKFDLLRILSERMPVINTPESIRNAANKYYSLHLLRRSGVPVPETVVTCDADVAMDLLDELGEIVVKPIFGYKGIGIERFRNDPDRLDSNRNSIEELLSERGVLYLQELIPMKRDLRVFVVGDRIAGSIYRYASCGWITNLSQSGVPERCVLTQEQEEIAIRASSAVGTDFAGVDLAETGNGSVVLEVNGTPSGKGIFDACGVDVTGDVVDRLIMGF